MKMKKILVISSFAIGIGLALGVALSTRQSAQAKGEEDFRIEGSELVSYVGNDTFVTVPSQVKVIKEGAFKNNTSLKSIELPEGLLEIHYNAFGGCSALEDITLPDSVIKVGPGAFKGCTALKMVEAGKNISSWGSGVFNDCTSLDKMVLDNKNLYLTYYDGALYNGDMTFLYQVLSGREGENYVTPETVKKIDTYAFYNLTNIKNIKIDCEVSKIPSHAMSHMGAVENVILSSKVDTVEENAFSDNANLKQIGMPKQVTAIKDKAVRKCPDVSIFTVKASTAEKYAKDNKLPVIYEEILPSDFNDSNPSGESLPDLKRKIVLDTEIDELPEEENSETFTEDASSEEETEPVDIDEDIQNGQELSRSVIVNGKAVFLMNNRNMHTVLNKSEQPVKEEPESEVNEKEETTKVETEPEKKADESETIKVTTTIKKEDTPTKETTIPQREYYEDQKLKTYEIPDGTKTIERLAFSKSALSEIDIPKSVKTIEYGAFLDCKNLSKVNIPDTVADISTKAFSGTLWLNEWLDNKRGSDDFLIAGDHILLAYRGKSDTVTIPEGTKMIAAEVFMDHAEIKYVELPASVTKIGADAFRNCKNLGTVTGGEGLKNISRGAFYGTQIDESTLKKQNK